MKHLGTFPTGDGYNLVWQVEGDRVFELGFRRVALGLSLEEQPFAVVVGERFYTGPHGQERVYVVIDEAEDALHARLFHRLIPLKDRYRAETLFAPDRPTTLVDTLRHTEGLTWYGKRSPGECRQLWPTYIDQDMRASLRQVPPPDEETVHGGLEGYLSQPARDPKSGLPLRGTDGEPIYRLHFPADLPVQRTQAGLRQALLSPCAALYLVVQGLERSGVIVRRETPEWEHKGNPLTGY